MVLSLLSLRVLELREKLALVHDRVDRLLIDDFDLRHFFESVECPELLPLHFPYLEMKD
jgi:hypothetical protein